MSSSIIADEGNDDGAGSQANDLENSGSGADANAQQNLGQSQQDQSGLVDPTKVESYWKSKFDKLENSAKPAVQLYNALAADDELAAEVEAVVVRNQTGGRFVPVDNEAANSNNGTGDQGSAETFNDDDEVTASSVKAIVAEALKEILPAVKQEVGGLRRSLQEERLQAEIADSGNISTEVAGQFMKALNNPAEHKEFWLGPVAELYGEFAGGKNPTELMRAESQPQTLEAIDNQDYIARLLSNVGQSGNVSAGTSRGSAAPAKSPIASKLEAIIEAANSGNNLIVQN